MEKRDKHWENAIKVESALVRYEYTGPPFDPLARNQAVKLNKQAGGGSQGGGATNPPRRKPRWFPGAVGRSSRTG